MTTTPIDLSRLPAPNVVEVIDYESLLAERKAHFVSLHPVAERAAVEETLKLESEPIVKALQESAYREMVLRQRVNDAARAVMLAYAEDADLDHLGALFGVRRLTLTPADPENGIAAVMESNSDFRKRIQLAPQGFSVAGPAGAYRSHALGADGRVLDALATSPAPCEVVVTILSREGNGQAPQDLIDAVAGVLGADDVRPLTDLVTVRSAQIVPYQVRAKIYTFPGPDSGVVLAEANVRLAAYTAETHRIGREVTLSGLYAALHVDGVERVELLEPLANVNASQTQATYCSGTDIQHGGIYG
ncbi:baseplate J/gp47 family protein [Cupriavidus taiwanensis]|uniref:Bacteriophage P2 Baseplate assembly protein GPJ n=1 Tax=Cupriavidus taiwanensis (strain DSM 17343 / BCRC 17206 / CCUG 44338 / CIP 107171 / LMG 19424 / R1) TaxID=977880 RepID=B3R3K3_CUPTR|nr:baseplate J/gp47 family protein [Cupriavidus taiwanensis]CAQ68885.1 bacteriophage P2 Baseplate assembly protein GPJ [Cupriavidus taiwanensis LMG 19424]